MKIGFPDWPHCSLPVVPPVPDLAVTSTVGLCSRHWRPLLYSLHPDCSALLHALEPLHRQFVPGGAWQGVRKLYTRCGRWFTNRCASPCYMTLFFTCILYYCDH